MPFTDAYDLSGLNSSQFLCGPYVSSALDPLDQDEINRAIQEREPLVRQVLGDQALSEDGGVNLLDVITFSPDNLTDLDTRPSRTRRYHLGLFEKFGVYNFLFEELRFGTFAQYQVQSQLHWYPKRSQGQIVMHHDTIGSTFFVILHYYNDETIYGPEFTFDTAQHSWFKRSTGLISKEEEIFGTQGPRFGPIDHDGVWPQELRTRLKDARESLFDAYGSNPVIKTAFIPPHGAVGFVDELIHHSTPMMDRRDDKYNDERFNNVQVQKKLGEHRSYMLSKTRARSTSFELKHESLNKTVQAATRSGDRSFMRLWVTIQPKRR